MRSRLRDKVQNALDEARLLVLGTQVLLGLEYRAAFETGFEKLRTHSQYSRLFALTLLVIVLPVAQALLGFQFVTVLMDSFDSLPPTSKYLHLISLSLIALTIILLKTPAAYHRIVERGEETEHFHRVATWTLLTAMVPLAMGICGDFFVVARKITQSTSFAMVSSIVPLTLSYGLWFGLTTYWRNTDS